MMTTLPRLDYVPSITNAVLCRYLRTVYIVLGVDPACSCSQNQNPKESNATAIQTTITTTMTQYHSGNKLTEVPLGAPVAEQTTGPVKKTKISGRTVLNIILALAVITAIGIGIASAAGVKFSTSNNDENNIVVENNALEANENGINDALSDEPTASPISQIAGGQDGGQDGLSEPTASPISQIAGDQDGGQDGLSEPTASPISQIAGDQDGGGQECLLTDAIDVRGDGTLLLRSGINAQEGTVTVELEYAGEAWLGFAFSESEAMVPNTAIIGLPDDEKVEKYSLESRSVDGVNPLNERQTLSATSITQNNGITTLKFTKPLFEENEVSISGVGDIRFNWAFGSSNDLGFHASRGSLVAPFAACLNPDVVDEETEAPTSALTASPVTESRTTSPTESPVTKTPATTSPTTSPTNSPTQAPAKVTLAPWTASPTSSPPLTGDRVYSKVGNRRSCSIDACPSSPWSGSNTLKNGCSCEQGLDTCYWDSPAATTIEYFSDVTLEETSVPGLWKLAATGDQLSLGQGGDSASGSDCFEDELRGGFRVDLTGTDFVLSEESIVTVSGYSPVMQMTTTTNAGAGAYSSEAASTAQEVRKWGEEAALDLWIPKGTQVVDVKCGGWPAYCTSELYVVRAGGY